MSGKFDAGRAMLVAAAALVAVVIGLSLSLLVFGPPNASRGVASSGSLGISGTALIGGDFTLTDHTGRAVDQSILEGQLNLIYFGFTFCPDFCPTELANMAAAEEALERRGVPTQLIFITIDPERDDQQAMADYVGAFDSEMVGLFGSPEQIRTAAQAYRVVYRKVALDDEDYTMDHTTFVYAMDENGRFITQFGYGTSPETIAERLIRSASES